MITGLVDTTVLIHILRNNTVALAWLNAQQDQLALTPISWMEVIDGAGSKIAQHQCKTLLDRFEIEYFTQDDLLWSMQQLEKFRLSNGSHMMDCLIASTSHRMQMPLYTHNVKDMTVLLGSDLVVKPY